MTGEPTVDLKSLSFYWRVNDAPGTNGGLPEFLPFEFAYDARTRLVIQKRNRAVLDCLRDAYQRDFNVGYLQDGHALAAPYGRDAFNFILGALGARDPQSTRIAEIGCGGAYLLKQLRDRGFSVLGIDPSPVAARQAAANGVEVLGAFYPDVSLRPVDLIFHYDVLEHVEDPVSFLRAHAAHLAEDGVIAFAVPDCTASIRLGDISMAIHEHLNYFDCDSLKRTVEAAGFEILALQKSNFGGVLYCAARPRRSAASDGHSADGRKFAQFGARVEAVCKRFREIAGKALDSSSALGIYVPLRLIPYLCRIELFERLRFFDDDPGIRGKYLSGFAAPIEGLSEFRAAPPDSVVVGSLVFADDIVARAKEASADRIDFVRLRDLLDDGDGTFECVCGSHAPA